jgi:hypothetical protein
VKLPNGDAAIIEIAKLRDYCLNPDHPRGKHKARVFKAVLDISVGEADLLVEALARAAHESETEEGAADEFGIRYIIDFELAHLDRSAIVRSCWIVRTGEIVPRFVTCFVR